MNAVSRFEAAIDALKLEARTGTSIKALGDTLYREGSKEWAEHIEKHLDAMVAENPTDRELEGRVTLLKTATASVKDGSDRTALTDEGRIRG